MLFRSFVSSLDPSCLFIAVLHHMQFFFFLLAHNARLSLVHWIHANDGVLICLLSQMCVAVKKVSLSPMTLAVFVISSHMVGEALFLCQVRNQTCLLFDTSVVFTLTISLSDQSQVDVFEKELMYKI